MTETVCLRQRKRQTDRKRGRDSSIERWTNGQSKANNGGEYSRKKENEREEKRKKKRKKGSWCFHYQEIE